MRLLILTTLLCFTAVYHETIAAEAERLLGRGDTAEVNAALELRCGGAEGLERKHCEDDLRDAFERGTSDAGAIVRLHCTRFENRWSEQRDESPICDALSES